MKIDLEKKISVYMFVIIVLVFVLIFAWICSSQMKFTVNKIMESQTIEEPTKTTNTYTPSNYSETTQDEVKKYQNYDY
jgi:hypothetical protein